MTKTKHGSGHVRSARALRYLFASGILSGHGKGAGRKVRYVGTKRAAAITKLGRERGGNTRGGTFGKGVGGAAKSSVAASPGARRGLGKRKNAHNHYTNAAKNTPSLGKSGAGLKAAHLRGGGGTVDHSATRAARIAAGKSRLTDHISSVGTSGNRELIARTARGLTLGSQRAKTRQKINLIDNARNNFQISRANSPEIRALKQRGQEALSAFPAAKARMDAKIRLRTAPMLGKEREAASKALARADKAFKAQRRTNAVTQRENKVAHLQGTGGKVDHSATRTARIAAGMAQRHAVVKDSELSRFREATQGRERRAAHYAELATKRRQEAFHHQTAANSYNRQAQPINANSRARTEARGLARAQRHATQSYQARDKADYWDEKAQHARTAGLQQLRHRVADRVQKQRLQHAEVGSKVKFLGELHTVRRKRKNDVLLEHPKHGLSIISTKI